MSELYPFVGHYLCGVQLATTHHSPLTNRHACITSTKAPGRPSSWFMAIRPGRSTTAISFAALRESFRTIVPDHIGCGLSDKPDDAHYPYTLARRADDLEALLDHLGIVKDITLVVHDWGGMIGMVYATRHPERIRRLVILNTGGFHLPKTKPFPWSLWFCRHPLVGPLLVRGANAFCWAAVRMCATRRPLPREVRRAFLAPYDSWANRIAVLRFVQDIPLRPGDPSYDLVTAVADELVKLRGVPMLICWGDRDFVFDRHFLAEWTERFPDAEVHRFADAGHYVLEDAAEEIVPLIQKWLGRA